MSDWFFRVIYALDRDIERNPWFYILTVIVLMFLIIAIVVATDL